MSDTLFEQMLRADEVGIRLEMVDGLPLWEAHPSLKHQRAVDRIRGSITPPMPSQDVKNDCQGIHLANVYVQFPDGSLKRPDISIFCREPEEEEEAIRLVPKAVIEVISKGYEAKDLEIGPRFYLSQGVEDVVVFDPYTLLVLHVRRDGVSRLVSPVQLHLMCGCRCEV
jgi:hypothetical protein